MVLSCFVTADTQSRRSFIRTVGLCMFASAAYGMCFTSLSACSPTEKNLSESSPSQKGGVQYAFWMDSTACIGCGLCVSACREASGTQEGANARRHLVSYTFENGSSRFLSTSCMHCAKPACAEVCPAGAISKRSDGIVVVDTSRCIGCKYCRQACPFSVPEYTEAGMDKCDCCLGNGVKPGQNPRCVQACPTKALRYGNLTFLETQTHGVAKRLIAPTEPSFLLS